MYNNTPPLLPKNVDVTDISIIIPMYNAEKYIAQCLHSIFNQTFKHYDIIVIDDNSTDKSLDVVDSFKSRFNGKLRVIKLKKNFGSPSLPRNLGLKLARGKYIYFMDSDDMILPEALNMLYKYAENFNADVVHSESYFEILNETHTLDKNGKRVATLNVKKQTYQNGTVNTATVETNNVAKRTMDLTQNKYMWNIWNKLYRRDFLIENGIEFFENISVDEDFLFSIFCVLTARNYLRIPDAFYMYRLRQDSVSHDSNIPIDKYLLKYKNVFTYGTKQLEDFLSKIDFFIKNDNFRYGLLNYFVERQLDFMGISKIYSKMNQENVYKLFCDATATDSADQLRHFLAILFNQTCAYKTKLLALSTEKNSH